MCCNGISGINGMNDDSNDSEMMTYDDQKVPE